MAALARAGKLTRVGVPKPSGLLEAAVLADTYADMVKLGFPLPPPVVQRVLLKPLAKLARRELSRQHYKSSWAALDCPDDHAADAMMVWCRRLRIPRTM